MINFLDKLYSSINDKDDFFKLLRINTLLRFLIRWSCNIYAPIYFTMQSKKPSLAEYKERETQIIVSLTSFPPRINRLWIVIECLLSQDLKPDRIILWLSKDQFKSEGNLPKKLENLKKRGLEVIYVEGDIKSHKKYFYSIKHFSDSIIITIDDDIFYPNYFIQKLYSDHLNYPNTIICNRGKEIISNMRNGYNDWPQLVEQKGPSKKIFFTSGGGTLFPPNSLHKDVLNKDTFMKACKDADDVWLNYMALLANTMIFKTSHYSALIPVISRNNKHLYSHNLFEDGNNIYIKNLEKIYNIKIAD